MTPAEIDLQPHSQLDSALANATKAARRVADEARQVAGTERTHEGYTIRPAIGSTGGARNVGWELIPPPAAPKTHNPTWYLRDRETALGAIDRHRARYAR